MIHFSFGGVPHLRVSWSGWNTDSLSSIIFLNLDPAFLKSVQSAIAFSRIITRINRDLLFGLAGSFLNFQSIRKITSYSALISIRVFLGNKGRINLTHSLTKDFVIMWLRSLLLKITNNKPSRNFLTSCPHARRTTATKCLRRKGNILLARGWNLVRPLYHLSRACRSSCAGLIYMHMKRGVHEPWQSHS